jgi:hypothetical protein
LTRDELWAIYTTKNPSMAGADDMRITLTARGLRKIFNITWEQAQDAGFANGQAWEKNQAKMRGAKEPAADIDVFKEMFGKKGSPFSP